MRCSYACRRASHKLGPLRPYPSHTFCPRMRTRSPITPRSRLSRSLELTVDRGPLLLGAPDNAYARYASSMIQPVRSVSGLTTRNGMSHSYHTLASETESVPNVQTHGVNGLLESDLIHRSGDTNRASWGSRLRPHPLEQAIPCHMRLREPRRCVSRSEVCVTTMCQAQWVAASCI